MTYLFLLVLTVAFLVGLPVQGEEATSPAPAPPAQMPGSTTAKLSARLIDADKKAKSQAATVEVSATGIELIDPAKVNEQRQAGQGHLHYQVDNGPVIATTATKLSFHGLTPGDHTIVVVLAGNDHSPLGPQETLRVKIP
jgi:hypothetical protein